MNILVLGGNGFIGSSVVKQLLLIQDCDITVVNRGRSWDWNKSETVKPHVRCILWDRKRPLADCTELQELNRRVTWQAVIDFSAYDGHVIKDTCTFLRESIHFYIYISSDSVYEVCEKRTSSGPTNESEATRPASPEMYKTLKRQDSYGHKKLKGEEQLIKAHKMYGFKYIILRLADVVGPMDSTDRWWSLQLWVTWCVQNNKVLLLHNGRKDTKLSLVYVEDIAKLVRSLVEGLHSLSSEVANQSYNLACEETATLESLVQDIALSDSGKQIEVQYTDSNLVPDYYPSVERGPVSIAKAKALLLWQPTLLGTVVKQTVDFYITCLESKDYHQEKKDIYHEIKKDLRHLYNQEDLRSLKVILKLK